MYEYDLYIHRSPKAEYRRAINNGTWRGALFRTTAYGLQATASIQEAPAQGAPAAQHSDLLGAGPSGVLEFPEPQIAECVKPISGVQVMPAKLGSCVSLRVRIARTLNVADMMIGCTCALYGVR